MNVALIARNTFRESTRDRVVAGVVIAGIALMLLTLPLGSLALGEEQRLTIDLGLTGISVLGLLIVLLVGTSLVAKEIERRTIFNLLSRPIGRPAYLVGKWLGLSGALWTVAGVLGVSLWAIAAVQGHGGRGPAILEASYLAGLELMVVTSLAVLFSALSTPVLSALYTLGFYCVGQWSSDLRDFAGQAPPALAATLRTIANIVPNLPLFNMRSTAAHGDLATPLHLGIATAYALMYCGCALALGAAAFESRDFK
ncbi:MAG: ABC transporter permease subunit [Candidatus Eisenbacteria bacterium]|uniref:ABC transporter permease subunit n=1 Tax=Eiseniibacteriota bacterium TaxID=2212470 RepID=A0A9D6QIP6_UNCEI|nr:ABC transporter permease subunit [Candidatus Eisenbacteria bacterium]